MAYAWIAFKMGCAATKASQGNCLHHQYHLKSPELAPANNGQVEQELAKRNRKTDDFHERYHKLLNRVSEYEKGMYVHFVLFLKIKILFARTIYIKYINSVSQNWKGQFFASCWATFLRFVDLNL